VEAHRRAEMFRAAFVLSGRQHYRFAQAASLPTLVERLTVLQAWENQIHRELAPYMDRVERPEYTLGD
jgi:hypothetical protein